MCPCRSQDQGTTRKQAARSLTKLDGTQLWPPQCVCVVRSWRQFSNHMYVRRPKKHVCAHTSRPGASIFGCLLQMCGAEDLMRVEDHPRPTGLESGSLMSCRTTMPWTAWGIINAFGLPLHTLHYTMRTPFLST